MENTKLSSTISEAEKKITKLEQTKVLLETSISTLTVEIANVNGSKKQLFI